MVLVADVLCIGGFFPVRCGFFPVIHSWSFVHHSSMFRVVDVVCAVSYTVAEDEWIFFLSVTDFFLCVMVYTVQ